MGGFAAGGDGGRANLGGDGTGGGMFNAMGGTVANRPRNHRVTTPASTFYANQASGGAGGAGGRAGSATGGPGGQGGSRGAGGLGGIGTGGAGGVGGAAGRDLGGGLANFGNASFSGITVDFRTNSAGTGVGGRGGNGGLGIGGNGGIGTLGGDGFSGSGGNGGNGGFGGDGLGGAIFDAKSATLVLAPRLGAKKGSKQFKATDTISANQANQGSGGRGGAAGGAIGGQGQTPGGPAGQAFPGIAGVAGVEGVGLGGGLDFFPGGDVTIDNTNITGNNASTADNDVSGNFAD